MADRLLGALLADAALPSAELRGRDDAVVTAVTHDSRRVAAGTLFCCIRGATTDGHEFAAEAMAAGATALLVDHPLDLLDVTQVVVPDPRWAMGHLAASFWHHPSRSLTMVGITGTNGKTTTASLLAGVLTAA